MNTTKQHSPSKIIIKIKDFAAKHKVWTWVICGVIALAISGGITAAILSQPAVKKAISAKKVVKPVVKTKYYSPLTGNLVADESMLTAPVTAVMIPNDTYGARPQAGLLKAGVVFEAICEGGITRFLALFQDDKPELIGPIRSVRMYYISWAAAFNASIIHYGGNMDALAEIRNGNYRDLDQMADNSASWRDANRNNPDDAFTSGARIDAQNTARGYLASEFTGFKREEIATPANTAAAQAAIAALPSATNINVTISDFDFNSSYIYNATTNTYARSQAGEPHLDTNGAQIAPNTVIAMRVDEYSSSTPENHEVITTIGSGVATVFQNGVAIVGTWSKPTQTDQIRFLDSTGTEIPLVRGQTWIVAVPNVDGDVSYTGVAV